MKGMINYNKKEYKFNIETIWAAKNAVSAIFKSTEPIKITISPSERKDYVPNGLTITPLYNQPNEKRTPLKEAVIKNTELVAAELNIPHICKPLQDALRETMKAIEAEEMQRSTYKIQWGLALQAWMEALAAIRKYSEIIEDDIETEWWKHEGKMYMRNKVTPYYCWHAKTEQYAGVWDEKKKAFDITVPNPLDYDEE